MADQTERDRFAGSRGAHGDWMARYGEYLGRTADHSARLLQLYQEVMELVSRGVLEPAALQEMLMPFAQARGTAFTGRLSELSMRFLGGLVQIATAYLQDLADAAPDGAAPPEPPPEFDAEDPARSFEQLAAYANRLRERSLGAYLSMLRRVAAGELDPEEARRAADDHLDERLPEHLRRLGGLYFDLLGDLSDLRASYEEEYLEGVLETARRDTEAAAASLELRATLGETASGSFTLENTRDEPMAVRCRVGDVRRADGVDPAFSPEAEIDPEALELAPGDEAEITVSVRLDGDDYAPETLYVGALAISRADEPAFEVPLRIVASAPAPAGEEAG